VSIVSRRRFLQTAAACHALGVFAPAASAAVDPLYNGITLPDPWPPRTRSFPDSPIVPPYLADPPRVVPIDVGRQLFVDDFLIEESTLHRTYHRAAYHPASPVLRPTQPWELVDSTSTRQGTPANPAAMVFSDGVFWDSIDRVFKMWYMGGYGESTCLALSEDGIAWRRPTLDVVAGTNIVISELRDSNTVWIDPHADTRTRYKMAWFNGSEGRLLFATSRDGIHWDRAGKSGPVDGDRTTFFYNPFRNVWVFSLRESGMAGFTGRFRRYLESATFPPQTVWRHGDSVLWAAADRLDPIRPEYAIQPELYNLDAVAYESVLLGLFTIWRGERTEREKPNDIVLGYSRDGFHWSRPDRRAFIGVSEHAGDWNWANVQSAGGGCVVVGDRLFFYVSGRQGEPGTSRPGVCSTGLATLRRDGFASIDDRFEPGAPRRAVAGVRQLTTRPVRFGGKYLWVNADVAAGGSLRVEILDEAGRIIPPFSLSSAQELTAVDGTRLRVTWRGQETLETVSNAAVRFRFSLRDARLYAFWVSASSSGGSRGYLAAGGPEYRDIVDAS
jgi:hypothetical protein